jgi:transposase
LRGLGIAAALAPRNTERGSGLGQTRWVAERTLSRLYQFRRLHIRWERRPQIDEGFLILGGIFICRNVLQGGLCWKLLIL